MSTCKSCGQVFVNRMQLGAHSRMCHAQLTAGFVVVFVIAFVFCPLLLLYIQALSTLHATSLYVAEAFSTSHTSSLYVSHKLSLYVTHKRSLCHTQALSTLQN